MLLAKNLMVSRGRAVVGQDFQVRPSHSAVGAPPTKTTSTHVEHRDFNSLRAPKKCHGDKKQDVLTLYNRRDPP